MPESIRSTTFTSMFDVIAVMASFLYDSLDNAEGEALRIPGELSPHTDTAFEDGFSHKPTSPMPPLTRVQSTRHFITAHRDLSAMRLVSSVWYDACRDSWRQMWWHFLIESRFLEEDSAAEIPPDMLKELMTVRVQWCRTCYMETQRSFKLAAYATLHHRHDGSLHAINLRQVGRPTSDDDKLNPAVIQGLQQATRRSNWGPVLYHLGCCLQTDSFPHQEASTATVSDDQLDDDDDGSLPIPISFVGFLSLCSMTTFTPTELYCLPQRVEGMSVNSHLDNIQLPLNVTLRAFPPRLLQWRVNADFFHSLSTETNYLMDTGELLDCVEKLYTDRSPRLVFADAEVLLPVLRNHSDNDNDGVTDLFISKASILKRIQENLLTLASEERVTPTFDCARSLDRLLGGHEAPVGDNSNPSSAAFIPLRTAFEWIQQITPMYPLDFGYFSTIG